MNKGSSTVFYCNITSSRLRFEVKHQQESYRFLCSVLCTQSLLIEINTVEIITLLEIPEIKTKIHCTEGTKLSSMELSRLLKINQFPNF